MLPKRVSVLVSVLSIAFLIAATFGLAGAAKPTTAAPCKQCHQPAENVIRGTLVSVSEKFKTVNVAVGSLVWVVKYGDDLKLVGADKLSGVSRDKEIGVTFKGEEKNPYAVSLSVKPPAKVAPEKLISVDEMAKLVEAGPEKGNFVLVDSRPTPRYNEGHIPYAVSMPLDKFDALKDKLLSKEKDRLLVFYCGGVT